MSFNDHNILLSIKLLVTKVMKLCTLCHFKTN